MKFYEKIGKFLASPFKGGVKLDKGMSLIEIIIVISLMGVLFTVIIGQLTSTRDSAMIDTSRLAMQQLGQSLEMYKVHNYRYPTDLSALISSPGDAKRWRGPYTEEKKLNDPWGTRYGYSSDGRSYSIISAGPDMQEGTSDDIRYPDDEGGGEGGGDID